MQTIQTYTCIKITNILTVHINVQRWHYDTKLNFLVIASHSQYKKEFDLANNNSIR